MICSKYGVAVEEDVRDLLDEVKAKVKAIVCGPRVKAAAAFVNEPDKKLNDLKTHESYGARHQYRVSLSKMQRLLVTLILKTKNHSFSSG